MYIVDYLCISPQNTYEKFFENGVVLHTGNKYFAIEPNYGEFIPLSVLRRMGKYTRMGVGTGLVLLKKHPYIEGIIIGSAYGGVDDCMKFLKQIEDFQEGTLTPTHFVQSTPNSLPGILSMMTDNVGYNNTHVHDGLSFENALIDAQMFLEEGNESVLVGAVEEISEWNYNVNLLRGYYKKENIASDVLLSSSSDGSVCGEGAAMFVLKNQSDGAFAQIKDVKSIVTSSQSEIINFIQKMLSDNNIDLADIHQLVLGLNGDVRTDCIYKDVQNKLFSHSGVITYKNLVGEYPTASSFAVWLSASALKGNVLPEAAVFKASKVSAKNILVYNHYNGLEHGFVLLSKV